MRTAADVIEEMRSADTTAAKRPKAEEILSSGNDAQLEFAMLILEARALKVAEKLAATPQSGAAIQ